MSVYVTASLLLRCAAGLLVASSCTADSCVRALPPVCGTPHPSKVGSQDDGVGKKGGSKATVEANTATRTAQDTATDNANGDRRRSDADDGTTMMTDGEMRMMALESLGGHVVVEVTSSQSCHSQGGHLAANPTVGIGATRQMPPPPAAYVGLNGRGHPSPVFPPHPLVCRGGGGLIKGTPGNTILTVS